ncbi:MAG: ATP-dependent DNA helicase RecG [Defluviitaleaceae bacterium]|nr:ATP-dependent DNA helicase RecG [Defluviitaleaceae bacterium]
MKVSQLDGIGAKRAKSLWDAGIFSIDDLLAHYPRDYDDRSNVKTIRELTTDAVNTIRGVVTTPAENSMVRRKNTSMLNITRLTITDHTGSLDLIWFNQPYLANTFKPDWEYIFTGKVKATFDGKLQMQPTEYEPCGKLELTGGRIVPIYTTPKQFTQKTFRAFIHQALEKWNGCEEPLPASYREKYDLMDKKAAVVNIHFPESNQMFLNARRRLVFEELFFMQRALFSVKDSIISQPGVRFESTELADFLGQLPFALTSPQANVLEEIKADVTGGGRMNRLIQGDVGSGKTAVAMAAAYMAMQNGYQVALMAPTDVLANQHFGQCSQVFGALGIETVLLTGNLGAKSRRESLEKIKNGQASMITGTHALFQEGVEYHNLGLVITDEQHRFGVEQRLRLAQKASIHPHTLVMTATPIPRTLGLVLYGDLDVSIIDQLPPGRQPIETYCVNTAYRQRLQAFIQKEATAGRQAYIICPAIEEAEETSETERAKREIQNVMNYTEQLSAALPDVKITYLHGKMKPKDKQQTMDSFKAGEIQAIVSTTVIEVGVNVPNATLMIIENAERFGLSQLHQLRGRVGRGSQKSYCVLVTDGKAKVTKARMKAMVDTSDGFMLAELDLKLRGAGDFFGTRQHGLPNFTIANLYRDMEVLKQAQAAAVESLPMAAAEEKSLNAHLQHVLATTRSSVM